MNNFEQQQIEQRMSGTALAVLWISRVVALIFAAGGIAAGVELRQLETHGVLLIARDLNGGLLGVRMFECMFFAFGFALGLEGAVSALVSMIGSSRLAGSGLVLSGSAFILFSLIAGRNLDQIYWSSHVSNLPFAVPGVLAAAGLYILLRASKLKRVEKRVRATAEQLLPQSPP